MTLERAATSRRIFPLTAGESTPPGLGVYPGRIVHSVRRVLPVPCLFSVHPQPTQPANKQVNLVPVSASTNDNAARRSFRSAASAAAHFAPYVLRS